MILKALHIVVTFFVWFFVFAFAMVFASMLFPADEPGEFSTISAWIGFGVGCFVAYKLWRSFYPKRSKSLEFEAPVQHRKSSRSLPTHADRPFSHDAKIDRSNLTLFEKAFGPSEATKIAHRGILRDREFTRLADAVSQHKDALQANWHALVDVNEYGKADYARWYPEAERFLDSIAFESSLISKNEARDHITKSIASSDFGVVVKAAPRASVSSASREAEERLVAKLVQKHENALVRNWHKTVRRDDYGSLEIEPFYNEVDAFLRAVSFKPKRLSADHVKMLVTTLVEAAATSNVISDEEIFEQVQNAYDYEEACAAALRAAGWSAKVTSASGDQGVDVLAKKDGLSVVVQCKLYGTAVGNSAVQQAIAGKEYEKADAAAVVAPNGFTRSAKELAASAGVHLLSQDDLRLLDRYVF